MSNSKQIKIIVGKGGKGSNTQDSSGITVVPGGDGQDGSAVVEYFTRG